MSHGPVADPKDDETPRKHLVMMPRSVPTELSAHLRPAQSITRMGTKLPEFCPTGSWLVPSFSVFDNHQQVEEAVQRALQAVSPTGSGTPGFQDGVGRPPPPASSSTGTGLSA